MNNLFIYFLNRELYRSLDIEYLSGVNEAIKTLLLGCGGKLYVPMSSLWEGVGYNDLDMILFRKIYDYGQIDIVSDCVTTQEFIEKNRQMYRFDKKRYRDVYFGKRIEFSSLLPTIIKDKSTTLGLSTKIQKWGDDDSNKLVLPANDVNILQINKSKIVTINNEREDRALTVSLFRGKLKNRVHDYAIARFLSVGYIEDYCAYIDGDIPTGVSRYLVYYDAIAKKAPYNSVPLIKTILMAVGIDCAVFEQTDYHIWDSILDLRARGYLERAQQLIWRIITVLIDRVGECDVDKVRRFFCSKVLGHCIDNSLQARTVAEVEIIAERLEGILNTLERSERTNGNYMGIRRRSIVDKKVFISHAEVDKEYVKRIVTFLEMIGLTENQIVCTSISEYGIPLGQDIYDYLREQLSLDIFVIFVLSENYYESVACLNEMGAAWIAKKEYSTILLPGFSFKDIKGAVNPRKVGIKLDDDEARVVDLLAQLRDNLQTQFGLEKISEGKWFRCWQQMLKGQ